MVNILPEKEQKKLRFAYYMRLLSVFLFGGALVVAISAAFLVPSYFLAQDEAGNAERFKDALLQTINLKGPSGTAKTVAALAEEVNLLKNEAQNPFAGAVIGAIQNAIPSKVLVQKIAITVNGQGKGDVTVAGKAGTRAALVDFVNALQKQSVFVGVTVPVENLASESDIDFSMSFSYLQK